MTVGFGRFTRVRGLCRRFHTQSARRSGRRARIAAAPGRRRAVPGAHCRQQLHRRHARRCRAGDRVEPGSTQVPVRAEAGGLVRPEHRHPPRPRSHRCHHGRRLPTRAGLDCCDRADLRKASDIDCIGGRVVAAWPDYVPSWFTTLQTSPLAICEHGDDDLPIDAGHAALCLLTANFASRRSAFEKAGMFSTDYPRGQDRELQLRMWRVGCRGLYAPRLVVMVPIPPARLKKPVLPQLVSEVWTGARAYGTTGQARQARRTREPSGRLTVVRQQLARPSFAGHVRFGLAAGNSAAL